MVDNKLDRYYDEIVLHNIKVTEAYIIDYINPKQNDRILVDIEKLKLKTTGWIDAGTVELLSVKDNILPKKYIFQK